MNEDVTRRTAGLGIAAATISMGAGPSLAQTPAATGVIETRSGKLRGSRSNGVSMFLGIPYGADTKGRRFQPALPAPSWTGVRDCVAYGNSAPQTQGMAPVPGRPASDYARFLASLFSTGPADRDPEASENCLVLNVFTPVRHRA